MVTFVLVSVPISFLNVLNEIAALELLSGASFLGVFQKSQLDALVMVFLNLHSDGLDVVNIFWGLWLFPFGVLVYMIGFLSPNSRPLPDNRMFCLRGRKSCPPTIAPLRKFCYPRYRCAGSARRGDNDGVAFG